jgi:hypothetical protein
MTKITKEYVPLLNAMATAELYVVTANQQRGLCKAAELTNTNTTVSTEKFKDYNSNKEYKHWLFTIQKLEGPRRIHGRKGKKYSIKKVAAVVANQPEPVKHVAPVTTQQSIYKLNPSKQHQASAGTYSTAYMQLLSKLPNGTLLRPWSNLVPKIAKWKDRLAKEGYRYDYAGSDIKGPYYIITTKQ